MSEHRVIDPSIFYVGNPVALVTTISPDGTVNIGPLSSSFTLGRTMLLGWEATSQTVANLERTGEAVVNYPSADRWEQVDAMATLTGHNPPAPHKADRFTYTNDKWTPSGLTPTPSEVVTPPRVTECPLQCEVTVDALHVPASEAPLRFAEVTIQRIHAHPDVLDPDTAHHIDTTAWNPMLYVFRDYVGTGTRHGTSRRKTPAATRAVRA